MEFLGEAAEDGGGPSRGFWSLLSKDFKSDCDCNCLSSSIDTVEDMAGQCLFGDMLLAYSLASCKCSGRFVQPLRDR